MKAQTSNQQIIDKDIMRYKKNNLASNLTLLSLVFECLYFLVMYGQVCGNRTALFSDGETAVYNIQTGVSVVLNLFILLAVFYASVQLKSYNKNYSFVVWAIAIIQIVRIFFYPLQTYNDTLYSNGNQIFGTSTLIFLIVYLILSAICLIAAGIIGYIRTVRLEKFNAAVAKNEVDLEAAYKEETEEVSANA